MSDDDLLRAYHSAAPNGGYLLAGLRAVAAAAAAAEREACAKVCEETTAAWTQPVYNGSRPTFRFKGCVKGRAGSPAARGVRGGEGGEMSDNITLRTAAQQALRVLIDAQLHNYALRHDDTDVLIVSLRAALAQQAEPVQTTHSDECWRWHHACAVAEIERLRAQVARLRDMARG